MGKQKKNKGGGGAKKKSKKGGRSFKPSGSNYRGKNAGLPGETAKVDNPFEIRMHRSKHDNLGRRARHEKGLPGVSRSKAIEKRRDTLLKEYKIRNKSSILDDKRIGEKVKNMPEEEKIIRRSVMEKRRQYKQKSIFNLPSTEEILTHKGQILMDIDRYEKPGEESDSEDERLNEEFVSDAHFGGGDFLKVKSTPDDAVDEDTGKSRKDIIAELILNSKKRKMEKAKEADESYELVSKLDQEFKTPDFRSLLTFMGKDKGDTKDKEPEPQPKKEDYDKLVRELHFEAKTGLASNRLKTEQEVQEEELLKLQKLEKDRLRRMQAQDSSAPNHKSADDLDDGCEVDEDIPTLTYQKDGKLNKIAQDDDDEDAEDESEEEDEEAEEGNEGEEKDSESEDSDAFSDLESDDEDTPSSTSQKSKKESPSEATSKTELITNLTTESDDIPYTLSLPKSYEHFKKLMIKYRAVCKDNDTVTSRLKIVTERLVKYTLLADKTRVPDLFVYLIKWAIEGVESEKLISHNTRKCIGIACVSLHSVLLVNPVKCVEQMEADIMQKLFPADKQKKVLLEKIVFYQICTKIFCVTDFNHRVLSPIKVDILDMINSTNISSYAGLLKILALCDIMCNLCKESKRYCPEVMKLLLDILEAVSLPPEKLRFRRRRLEFLRINTLEEDKFDWECRQNDPPLITEDETVPCTRREVLLLLLRVFESINLFVQMQHKTRTFNHLIFKVMQAQHRVLTLKWSDKEFHKVLFDRRLPSSAISSGEGVEEELPSVLADRPKILKLYEPLIEENFDGNRKRKLKRKGQTLEESRLSHKVKKEMKSAAREILKDNAFLAKQQLKEQAMKDAERNRRVKEILGGLSNQEGDYRKIKRNK